MKDIKDYLHLYLGCEIKYSSTGEVGIMKPVTLHFMVENPSHATPILRPLSDMTEEEAKEILFLRSPLGSVKDGDAIVIVESMVDGKRIKWHFQGVPNIPRYANVNELSPQQFQYLLSKGFDVFDLIPAGLAIDKTTLKQTA